MFSRRQGGRESQRDGWDLVEVDLSLDAATDSCGRRTMVRIYERHGYSSVQPGTNERSLYYFREVRRPT